MVNYSRQKEGFRVDFHISANPNEPLIPMVIKWIDEIVADLVGAALAGADFGESSLIAMVMPDKAITYTDLTHPIPVTRPFISLFFLEYIQKHLQKNPIINGMDIQPQTTELGLLLPILEDKIKIFSISTLDAPVTSLPTLAKFDIRAVIEAMNVVIDLILDSDLEGQKFGEILINCYLNTQSSDLSLTTFHPIADDWGKNIVDKTKPFIFDLSNFIPPEYAIPVAFPNVICWLFPGASVCTNNG